MIEEVKEDIFEEEEVEVVAAIVESELVEIIFYFDTMKRIELRSRMKHTKNLESQEKQRMREE